MVQGKFLRYKLFNHPFTSPNDKDDALKETVGFILSIPLVNFFAKLYVLQKEAETMPKKAIFFSERNPKIC